jgi:glycosyltransferase involved in cell wall biosynthesis
MPLISIVIPAFNRTKLLQKTIASVQSQNFKDWECIIVDDFSTDNTKELIEAIALNDSRIKYCLNRRGKGAQGARNTGILQAEGSWIAFNDSDDEWLPEKLTRQICELKKVDFDPYTVVHGNCIAKDHQNNTQLLWELPIVDGFKPYSLLLKGPSPVFPNILTSKKALEEIGLLDENVPSYQEWDTALLLSAICSFIHIQDPLFVYNLHHGDTISKNKRRDIAGKHYILMKYREDIIGKEGSQFFIYVLLDNIKRIIGYKEWNYGIKLLKEARPHVPLKSFLYYSACFRLRLNPDSFR